MAKKLDPNVYFPRLIKMMEDYCRLFHAREAKKPFVPKGLLARYPTQVPDKTPAEPMVSIPEGEPENHGPATATRKPRRLCAECTRQVILAATMKILCPFKGEIPCSNCTTPCVNDPTHQAYMKKVMWVRVAVLILTLQWKIVFDHLFVKT